MATTALAFHPLNAAGAVLQYGAPLPIRGTAVPGATVQVSLGAVTAQVVAGPDGRWLAWLPPQAVARHQRLEAIAGAERCVADDLAIGEVVLCSGQSNMEWPVSQSAGADAALAAPADPDLRGFVVPHRCALDTPASTGGCWSALDEPERRGAFGAVPYYAGRALRAAHPERPLGLILCAWGGTPIEAWLPPAVLEPDEGARRRAAAALLQQQAQPAEAARLAGVRAAYEQVFRAWQTAIHDGDGGEAAGCMAVDAPIDVWEERPVPGHWPDQQWGEHQGAVWCACDVQVPAELAGRPATLLLGEVDNEDSTWLNGVRLGGIDQMAGPDHWQMLREYPVPAGLLRAGRNRLCVRVVVYAGRGGLGGHPSGMALRIGETWLRLPGRWRCRRGGALPARPRPLWPAELCPPVDQHLPGSLFAGMLAPLLPAALGGVWWYQGENNVDRAHGYAGQLQRLVTAWRRAAAGGAPVPPLPVSVVQLASYKAPTPEAGAPAPYAELRAAQARILDLPAGGLATAIDLGEAGDIHPRRKAPVGARVAAVHRGLRGDAITAAPPRPCAALRREGGLLRLDFDRPLMTRDGGPVQGVAVQDAGGPWRWAVARCAGATLWIDDPWATACRYGWSDNALHANLMGGDGWAVEPFFINS